MSTSIPRIIKGEARVPLEWRRIGYIVGVAINLALLWIVTNLVEWGWPQFITSDFEEVVPLLAFSLVLGISFYIVYFFYDPGWVRTLGDAITSAVALLVIIKTFQVFPFEFQTGIWTGLTRGILILTGIAVTIGLIATTVKLLTGKTDRH